MKLKDTGLTAQDIKDKVSKYMIETYERFDFIAETAKDQYVYGEKGEPYLDFYAGIAVNSAGNCNQKVVDAVIDQVQDVMHTFNYPYTIPQALLAEKICTTIGMDKIFYQNSGTEANEAQEMLKKWETTSRQNLKLSRMWRSVVALRLMLQKPLLFWPLTAEKSRNTKGAEKFPALSFR